MFLFENQWNLYFDKLLANMKTYVMVRPQLRNNLSDFFFFFEIIIFSSFILEF